LIALPISMNLPVIPKLHFNWIKLVVKHESLI
jgi:hypothetical protein